MNFFFVGVIGFTVFGLAHLFIPPNRIRTHEFESNRTDLWRPVIESADQRRPMVLRTSSSYQDSMIVRLVQANHGRLLEDGVIALVEESIATELEAIPDRNELLEEEPIIDGTCRGFSCVMIVKVFMFLSYGFSGVRELMGASPEYLKAFIDSCVAMVAFYMAFIPWFGRWDLHHRALRFAGPGWIRCTYKESWFCTIRDSVMLIRPNQQRQGICVLVVKSTGPSMTFEFDSVQDEGFIDFWNRWSTSSPRLELIEAISP